MDGSFPGVAVLPPEDKPTQQWNVAFDSGTYTLRSVASGLYLGNDGDPNESSMVVRGTGQPSPGSCRPATIPMRRPTS